MARQRWRCPLYEDATAVPGERGYTGVIVSSEDNESRMAAFCLSKKNWYTCIAGPGWKVGDALTGLTALPVDIASGTVKPAITTSSTSQLYAPAAHAVPRPPAVPGARGYTGVIVCIDDNEIWMEAFCLSKKRWHKCIWRPEEEVFDSVRVGDALTGLRALSVDMASRTIELTIAPSSTSQLCALAARAAPCDPAES